MPGDVDEPYDLDSALLDLQRAVEETRGAPIPPPQQRRAKRARGQSQPPPPPPATEQPEIAPSNKGHVLLRRLGWEPGQGLGAGERGGLTPLAQLLPTQRHKGGLGVGSEAIERGDVAIQELESSMTINL